MVIGVFSAFKPLMTFFSTSYSPVRFDLLEGNKLNWEIRAEGVELIVVMRPLEEYYKNKKELKNMNKITLKVETITPLFIVGADQRNIENERNLDLL